MAELWQLGVRGASLDVVAAWKDVLLAAALAVALLGARSLPLQLWADRLALAYAAFVLLYWLLPQSWLDGSATHRGQLFAARHDLIPVAAYFLGRLLVLTPGGLAPDLAGARRRRRGADAVGARRRLPGAAPVVARLRRARLVRRSARAHLPRALGAAGELGLQHRRREQPDPAPRLGLPQPARDRVRARDRPPLPRCPPADLVDRDRRA